MIHKLIYKSIKFHTVHKNDILIKLCILISESNTITYYNDDFSMIGIFIV